MASYQKIDTKNRSVWWWIFCFPGAMALWWDYMNPESVRGVFGTARRRNVPLFQFTASICVYGLLFLIILYPALLLFLPVAALGRSWR